MSSSARSSPTSDRCLATSLPLEIFDLILNFRLAVSDEYNRPYFFCRDLALVCHAWRAPVQRRLLSSVVASGRQNRTLLHLADVLGSNQVLASYVRSLEVDFRYTSQPWTVEELVEVLQALPNVKSLRLILSSASPGLFGDYSGLEAMPLLESLSIHGNTFDKDSVAIRQILAAPPNIKSLSLGNDKARSYAPPTRKRLVPVHLPNLTTLTLAGLQFSRIFEKLRLLSPETLAQIDDLSIDDSMQWHRQLEKSSSIGLLSVTGSHIKSLRFPGESYTNASLADMLRMCPVIETLSVTGQGVLPPTLPATLHTISYCRHQSYESSIYFLEPLLRGVNLAHVKVLQIGKTIAKEGLKTICRDQEVELYSDSGNVAL